MRAIALVAAVICIFGAASALKEIANTPTKSSELSKDYGAISLVPVNQHSKVETLRFIIVLHSATFNLLYPYRHWQSEAGPGCLSVNHQPIEWENFNKLAFMQAVRAWADDTGCNADNVIPPTYFMTSSSKRKSDCARLFSAHDSTDESVWFQKDPRKDGFGMGVNVHSIDTLQEFWNVSNIPSGQKRELAIRERCAQADEYFRRDNTMLLVQKGVEPLLLHGSRKFDIRLYVLITDRAPYAAYLHWAYLRFSDTPTKKSTGKGMGPLDRSQHIANINIADPKHELKDHWIPQPGLERLLDAPEAKPVLDSLGLKNGAEAMALIEANTKGALSAAFAAMRANAGTERGGFVLCGIDVLLDTKLRAYVLETNVDPEFGDDYIRLPIGKEVGKTMFQLVADLKAKTMPLFGPSIGDDADPRGMCFGDTWAPVSRASPAGQELLSTTRPGWTLLYSEAVTPPYSIAEELRPADADLENPYCWDPLDKYTLNQI